VFCSQAKEWFSSKLGQSHAGKQWFWRCYEHRTVTSDTLILLTSRRFSTFEKHLFFDSAAGNEAFFQRSCDFSRSPVCGFIPPSEYPKSSLYLTAFPFTQFAADEYRIQYKRRQDEAFDFRHGKKA
jgi:hypothetical protein